VTVKERLEMYIAENRRAMKGYLQRARGYLREERTFDEIQFPRMRALNHSMRAFNEGGYYALKHQTDAVRIYFKKELSDES
jgi:hypothetical protein